VHGGRIGDVGGFPSWSSDGSLLVSTDGVTGTAVVYEQPMSIFSIRRRRTLELLRRRVSGGALAGPGGWILYGRYDETKRSPEGDTTIVPDRLYLARLAPRWRE
jgi:hypothetical protein